MLRIFLLAACMLHPCAVLAEVCVEPDLPNWQHDIAGRLCIIDQTTLVIRDFGYDGRGPDAYLYYYTTEQGYTASNVPGGGSGSIIPHPQTGGRFPGGRVSGQTLQFSLPDGVYACDLAVFTIWCQAARVHFTGINIPQSLFTTDPSEAANGEKILCTRDQEVESDNDTISFENFDNCKQLDNQLTLEWTVDRTREYIAFRLCGCTSDDPSFDNTWLGFGLSGSSSETLMFGADATIVWVDRDSTPHAEDYYLSAYTQCGGGVGACPDSQDSSGNCSNSATLISGFTDAGSQCVVFTRNFTAGDQCDQTLDPDKEDQYIVWGVGGLGDTAFRHFDRAERSDPPIHLGREPSGDCSPLVCVSCPPFETQTIAAPSDTTFVARIGPSGDQRGYIAITGRAGWGIGWYINDTLIPTLVVQRGKTYTFVSYGGDDPNDNPNYHPFYITSSISGGRVFMDDQEKAMETIYAGVVDDGDTPIGVGPLCGYKSTVEAENLEANCSSSFHDYLVALNGPTSDCGSSVTDGSNSFQWTLDCSTPDLVYYQCYTHRNLGWKIVVTDSVEDYMKGDNVPQPQSCSPTPTPTPTPPSSSSLAGATPSPSPSPSPTLILLDSSPGLTSSFLLSLLLLSLSLLL